MDVKVEARKTALIALDHEIPTINTQTKEAAQDIAFGSVRAVNIVLSSTRSDFITFRLLE